MVSNKNLEIELQELFKQKRYSEIVFEITTKTNESERSSGLFNLLGISRITDNRKDKNIVSLAVEDFKKGEFSGRLLSSEKSMLFHLL